MRTSMVGLLVASCCWLATGSLAVAQEFPKPEITEGHKVLRKEAGIWKAKTKFWAGGPESDPVESEGTERVRLIGGLWAVSNFTGEFGGQRFVGHGITGYDKDKNEYVMVWIDSMSDKATKMHGTFDAEKNELTLTGEAPGPDGKMTKMKSVVRYVGRKQKIFTMYMGMPEGKWARTMEITYTRQPRKKK